MDPISLIAILGAWAVLFTSQVMEGGNPATLVSAPSPLLLVFGGTLAAAAVSTQMSDLAKIVKATVRALFPKKLPDRVSIIETLANLADIARREGLLALEKKLDELGSNDPFLRRGVELILDGIDPDRLRDILWGEIESLEERHKVASGFWHQAGGYAPTVGILGTVMGLVHVLENLSTPDKLGPAISSAFLATLWGVGSANLLWLPLSQKMKRLTAAEVAHRELIAEGLMDVQGGASPRALTDKLKSVLTGAERAKLGGGSSE